MCFLVVATKLIKKIFLSFRKNILPLSFEKILPCSVMVAHQFLALLVWVRILARQQKKQLSIPTEVFGGCFSFLHTILISYLISYKKMIIFACRIFNSIYFTLWSD